MSRRVTIPEFQRILANLVPEIEKAMIKGLRSGALQLHRVVVSEIDAAQPFPAVDTGELRNSVDTELVRDGAIVSVKAPHAAIIEYGTRPFWPPLSPLIRWVERKRLGTPEEAEGIARAIQRKIAKVGIAPRHYFAAAWARALPMIQTEVLRELAGLGYGHVRGRGTMRRGNEGGQQGA